MSCLSLMQTTFSSPGRLLIKGTLLEFLRVLARPRPLLWLVMLQLVFPDSGPPRLCSLLDEERLRTILFTLDFIPLDSQLQYWISHLCTVLQTNTRRDVPILQTSSRLTPKGALYRDGQLDRIIPMRYDVIISVRYFHLMCVPSRFRLI